MAFGAVDVFSVANSRSDWLRSCRVMVEGTSALARKLSRFMPLGEGELASLAALETPSRPIAAGTELLYEHQIGHRAFVLHKGWACSYKLLPDGGRQVIDL